MDRQRTPRLSSEFSISLEKKLTKNFEIDGTVEHKRSTKKSTEFGFGGALALWMLISKTAPLFSRNG